MLASKNLLRIFFALLFVSLSNCFLGSVARGQAPQSATAPSEAEDATPPTGDYNRLIHPQVADELGLSDEQRALIQSLLADRTELMASAGSEDRQAEQSNQAQIEDLNGQIRNVLNDAQLDAWADQAPQKKLRFQFREQPWGDVLQWFARQEGLTLVMNQVPPGTFTYTDTRSYSAAEAIDLLNSVLLTHGYTLVRREKMLTVLELSNSIPIELVPRVELEELPSRGRFELISVLFPLGNRPVDAVIKEVQPYLGSFGRAIALPQSKQLLVIETAGKMDTINVLINTVPEPKPVEKAAAPKQPPAPVFAAYTLGNLDPQLVLSTVKELVGSERIAVDVKTRLLTAYVVPDQQTAIQSAIEKMRDNLSNAPVSVSVAYPLRSGGEEQIREQVTAIAPHAVVSIDEKAMRVLITAPSADQQRIATAFKAMGISAIDEPIAVKAFQVEPAQATIIAAAIQDMIPAAQVVGNRSLGTLIVRGSEQEIALAEQVIERWRGTDLESGTALQAFELPRSGTNAWLSTVAKVVPQAKIWLDADAKQLILLGTEAEKTRLEDMLPQLLTALPSPPDRLLKTYSLSASELEQWNRLQPILTETFPEIRPIIREDGEDGSAEMLVWATAENQANVAEALEQVKQATPTPKRKWPKIYEFGKQDPTLFSELIQSRFPGIRITIDAASNRLTVWAEQDTHEELAELLAQIANELPSEPELTMKTYRLEGRTPSELQSLISPVLASVNTTQSRGTFKPIGTITVDNAARRLMIMATEQAHEQIEAFVTELDKPMPPEQELILLAYSLDEAGAADVKTLIDQTVEGATVVADDRRNQLIVTATLAQHGRIKTLISEIDRPASKFASDEIRAYELTDLKATTILTTLQSMWPQMKLSADVASNQIVASGNADEHESFKESIERLNLSPSGEEMRVVTYDVPMGDLRTLPTVLTQIAPQAIISTDAINRAIFVWANDDQHKRIASAIQQLTVTAEGRREIEIYEVPPDRAAIIRGVLASLFPTATVGADATTGQLTVLASSDIQSKIAEVLDKTNRATEEGSKLEPRLYDAPESIRTAFASVLRTTLPRATVVTTGANDPNKIMVLASPEDHQRVASLLAKLSDETGPVAESIVQAYELNETDPLAFGTMLSERHPNAKVLSGAKTNRLVIATSEDDHAAIGETIDELETAFAEAGQQDLRVYPIRKDLTQQAVIGLKTVVPQARLMPSNDPERIVILASPTEHTKFDNWLKQLQEQVPEPAATTSEVYPLEYGDPTGAVRVLQTLLPQVVFAADKLGKSVAATATQEDHATIKAFVQQYDDRQMDDAETKVFQLGDADAMSMSQAVTQMAPTARVTPDRASNRLVVTAPKDILARVTEAIENMDSDPSQRKTTNSYSLESGNPVSLSAALRASYPRATVSADYTNNSLIVSATEEEHKEIAKLVDSMNSGGKRVTRSYQLESGNANTMRLAVLASFPKTTIGADSASNSLIVSATEEEHTQIAELVDSFNSEGLKTTKSYAIESGSAASIRSAVAASFPKATISADYTSNSLIVSATAEDQTKIAAFVEDLNTGAKHTTESYVLENGDPNAMRLALQSTYPQATIGADRVNDSLIVSATDEEHLEIAKLVEQINSAPGRSEAMQAYSLSKASPQVVAAALQQAFGRGSGVGVSADEEGGTVFVVGLPKYQQIAKQVIEQMDRIDPLARDRRLKAFALSGIDGDEVADAVQSLFLHSRPEVEVRYDFYNDQLVVIGNSEQLQLVEETLLQFEPPDRELAIFPLQENDPNSVRDAVDALFADLPSKETPTITIDEDRQQLLIRGTSAQMVEIRDLLARLGETLQELGTATSPTVQTNTRVRTIIIGRDSESLLEQLQKVWPSIRKNPLQVIRPDDTLNEGTQGVKHSREPAHTFVAMQSDESALDENPTSENAPPAIIILPSEGRWVVASEDTEALQRLTELMEIAVSPPMTPVAENGNLSIYVLQHGNADDLENLLQNLFRQDRSSRSRLSPSSLETRIVADTRINALIVQASRADRGVIEDLLSVLDSPEFVDALQLAAPQLIPIEHTDAERVEVLLRTVYSSQLSRGSKRPQISIPEGVSEEVASMLEQINAEVSGPLLTLSVDEISNSIVMRAPPELSEQIRTFIEQVDTQADTNRTGRMRIIQLQQTNADQIERALQLMRGQSRSRRR